MGCSQSKLLEATANGGKTSSPYNTASPSRHQTRDRVDSWAVNNHNHQLEIPANSASGSPSSSPTHQSQALVHSPSKQQQHNIISPAQPSSPRPTIESQWKFLWETHSPFLLDPADVHSVLDSLVCKTVNRLSPVEVTLIQRHVRSMVKTLAASSKPRTVFNSKAETEGYAVVERFHLLNEALINKILPQSPIQKNAYTLMLYLSETLWDRVAEFAAHTAKKASLEMDVNKMQPWKMPKPSVVPDVVPAEVPPGVTMQSLSFLMAIARNGTRRQRLLLLFYLLVDKLDDFMQAHPAGGTPTWLLELDQNTVVSLASLAHYHYFGHGEFLPVSDISPPPFCRSNSRQPLSIQTTRLRGLLQTVLLSVPARTEDVNSNIEASYSLSRRNSKTQMKGSIHKRFSDGSVDSKHVESDVFTETTCHPKTLLMKRLAEIRDRGPSTEGSAQFPESLLDSLAVTDDEESSPRWRKKEETNCMSLQEFSTWADETLDDCTLEALMERLFTEGILPTAELEKELVQHKWLEWQTFFEKLTGNDQAHTLDALTLTNGSEEEKKMPIVIASSVWGGIGGIDGGGAIGHGVLYCIEKQWWDEWADYADWRLLGDRPRKPSSKYRPGDLSTERLLDDNKDSLTTRGSLGSYEIMKSGLKLNIDYVLIPPGVWDILYELYGGGPPLPRIVKPPERKCFDIHRTDTDIEDALRMASVNGRADELDTLIESLDNSSSGGVSKIPDNISVALHPWIIHTHLCDPTQPYRRGDAGTSIRIMTTPDAPVWRLLAEIFMRFPLHAYKAFDGKNAGKGRLWKKSDTSSQQKDAPVLRYGPWNLLFKSRHALIPFLTDMRDVSERYSELVENWKVYTDNATVESSGLVDRDNIMFEFAIVNRNSELVWPREAAAKAGKVRRLAEEDANFRELLQGVDENGAQLLKPANLQGLKLDAMDASGRWFPVTILEADIIDDEMDEDTEANGDASSGKRRTVTVSRKKVRVDFAEHGGHQEWIDVECDRLAILGRFTSDTEDRNSLTDSKVITTANPSDAKQKPVPPIKKAATTDNGPESGKICLWPGFGACGLTNLGNTCYSNSAIQCMSYLPVLRSYLLGAQYKTGGDINKDNPLGTGGKLLEEFSDLLRVLWSAKTGEKSPTRFRTQLGKINSQFAGADQQDAQEFLNYILDMLHEDSNKVRKKPYVEAVDDDWVKNNCLLRFGEETWRRFLRRNRSIMTDVAMGQVLNTVTCPICSFTSKNFDPFNLLSIPIPTVADVVFQCTVYRRATAVNCPWVLDRPRKGEKSQARYPRKTTSSTVVPPSDVFSCEEYILVMSRLADSGDIRLQLQNICGIPSHQLRLCRVDINPESPAEDSSSVVKQQLRIIPLTDTEGPCSQLAKKRLAGDKGLSSPTLLVAFEATVRPRPMPETEALEDGDAPDDTADEEEELELEECQLLPAPKEQIEIEKYLDVYGDDKECRMVDTNCLILAKAVSRSLWPRDESELKLGLRVDAKDNRGNWFPGNIVEIVNDGVGGNDGTAERKVRIHFDNFAPRWDELYEIKDFREGKVRPLYAHSSPRPKPTEFIVHHRHTDRSSGKSFMFGQSFFIQCQNEWSNARAGAHILAQASRFIRMGLSQNTLTDSVNASSASREGKIRRLYERTQTSISDLIDLLIDCDREYIRLALGVSEHNSEKEKRSPFRNSSFDPTPLSSALVKKVANLLHKLPFEIRMFATESGGDGDKNSAIEEEFPFPFSLIRTIGNFINARHAVILHWREPPVDKTNGSTNSYLDSPVMYVKPVVEIDEASARAYKNKTKSHNENENIGRPSGAGIDLGVCLTEFCKVQNLTIADSWRCPQCKDFREGQQSMNLWRLPDLLTFHIKRFNMSARWREKITTKVNFPLSGLDMREWFHGESPMLHTDSENMHIYDLIGVVNHYGSMTGGHYVATCKASVCGREGQEEVAYNFNGVGATTLEEDTDIPSGWRLGRPKTELNHNKVAAAMASQTAVESSEPLWLQFDDELVEPISPEHVVSEMAYVLFYRRRQMTPSNIVKYSTLD